MVFDDFLLKSAIKSVTDWPVPGEKFRDISPLSANPTAMRMVSDQFIQRYIGTQATRIVTIDTKGLLFAPIIAYGLNLPLSVIRRNRNLPGDTLTEVVPRSSGDFSLSMYQDACQPDDQVLLFDDLIARGDTLLAACALVRRSGARIAEAATVLNLTQMGGESRLREADIPVYTLLSID